MQVCTGGYVAHVHRPPVARLSHPDKHGVRSSQTIMDAPNGSRLIAYLTIWQDELC